MNDPYKVLGISTNASDDDVKAAYKRLIRDYAGNDDKIKELTDAYDSIMNMRRGGHNISSEYMEIRQCIRQGNYDEADRMLSFIGDRGAEWNFLKGSVCYGKGWLDDAYNYFSAAVRMDPSNPE
ncbi:MAG: DnaJ domain-containing protein, partial [Oscillospiraceae bacterium]